jgi:L-threonylcarbamoyladenylate synthase
VSAGGVCLFPADTVYGLACDPTSADAVTKLYSLKGRTATKPAAVMFFDLDQALAKLAYLGARTREAIATMLPDALTLLVPNPLGLYPLACADTPQRLGIRVPRLSSQLAALSSLRLPLLQSSANLSGSTEVSLLSEVDQSIRRGVDLELDVGRLPGTHSTVVDLTRYEVDGGFEVLREGAVARSHIEGLL